MKDRWITSNKQEQFEMIPQPVQRATKVQRGGNPEFNRAEASCQTCIFAQFL